MIERLGIRLIERRFHVSKKEPGDPETRALLFKGIPTRMVMMEGTPCTLWVRIGDQPWVAETQAPPDYEELVAALMVQEGLTMCLEVDGPTFAALCQTDLKRHTIHLDVAVHDCPVTDTGALDYPDDCVEDEYGFTKGDFDDWHLSITEVVTPQ